MDELEITFEYQGARWFVRVPPPGGMGFYEYVERVMQPAFQCLWENGVKDLTTPEEPG